MSEKDSIEFEIQREKVNKLLSEREIRFGDFNTSIKKRTGIFGLKTKKDMQASIEILQSIVLTDEEIFSETKKLLSFKDQLLSYQEVEKNEIQDLASEYDQRINGYISTISKLQRDRENIMKQVEQSAQKNGTYMALFFVFLGLTLFFGLLWWTSRQKLTKK